MEPTDTLPPVSAALRTLEKVSPQDSSLLQAALEYATQGLHVFPVHSIRDGQCACDRACSPKIAGKHPIPSNGHKSATTDESQIRKWWTQHPFANIGIATEPSGLIVVDLDVREGKDGIAEWQELQDEYGAIDTLQAITGSGGLHLYMWGHRQSGSDFRPGLDIKSAGGYVLAPPSSHFSGGSYEWDGAELDVSQIKPAPAWVYQLQRPSKAKEPKPSSTTFQDLGKDIKRAKEAIQSISPDCDYQTWVDIGMALQSTNHAQAFQIWNQWSSKGQKYEGRDATRRKWDSFQSTGITLSSLFHHALDNGWQEQRDQEADEVAKELTNDHPPDQWRILPSNGNARPYQPNPNNEDTWGLPTTKKEALRRYVQIQGLDAVLDRKTMALYSASEFRRIMNGRIFVAGEKKPIPWDFLSSPNRPSIHSEDLVFAPGDRVFSPRVNLFTGIDLDAKPTLLRPDKEPSVLKILELLHSMANEQSLFEWLLYWLAYPIQNLGQKLRSALVVHGPQGTGKSLIFNHVMRTCYGKWSRQIGQHELDSTFNGWASKCLYLVAEECSTSSTVRETSGRIKALITEPTLQINVKHQRLRYESNHLNAVFLSNEAMPLWADQDDRRLAVVLVPPEAKRDRGFYEFLVKEHERMPEAWYQFLRDVVEIPQDFATRPVPMTRGKQALLEACQPSTQRFLRQWLDGDIQDDEGEPVPILCFRSNDLYRLYRNWAEENGHRPKSAANFTAELPPMGFEKHRTKRFKFWTPPGAEKDSSETETFGRLTRRMGACGA